MIREVPNPLQSETNYHVVAALLLKFLQLLPHPIMPPKLFFTVMRLGAIPSQWNRYRQLRVLVSKLPSISKKATLALLMYLHSTGIDCTNLANIFGKFLLRPAMENDATPLPVQATRVISEMMQQAPYITINTNQPSVSEPTGALDPVTEFKLLATALFDFSSEGIFFAANLC